MKKVLISTSSFGKADKRSLELCNENCEVVLNPYGRKLTTEEFIDLTEDVDAVIAGVENITKDALIKRPNIKVISRCGVGLDSVDQNACKELGVKLFNTPNAPVGSVAEMTITLILNILKNISNMNGALKQGQWNKMSGYMLEGKNVGIIGMGRIGKRVAELLQPFHVSIAYCDIEDKKNDYTYMSKEELLKWADIVTIHTSNCPENEHIIGHEEFNLMKKNAYLVNTSRGRFVDEDALFNALKESKIAGAALDVFQTEPYSGKLKDLDNVILTPHVSSSAKEGRAVMELEAVFNLLDGLGITYDQNNYI